MSKVNYAKIRNAQKKSDFGLPAKNYENSPQTQIQPQINNLVPYGESTPYPNSSPKIESANLANIFGESVYTDNLDYINSLLKSQLPDNIPGKPQRKKKLKEKAEALIVEPGSPDRLEVPCSLNDALKAPLNSPGGDASSSMLYGEDLNQREESESRIEIPEAQERKPKPRDERIMSNTISIKDAEMYEEYFEHEANDPGKRSMSLEDLKVPKKDQLKPNTFAKGNLYISADAELVGEAAVVKPSPSAKSQREVYQDSENSIASKKGFSVCLDRYIDYFTKSETMNYKTIKASQYFMNATTHRGNNQSQSQSNSHSQSQRSVQTLNGEMEKMKNQIKKLKEKVNELQLTNELCLKERKAWKRKEQEAQLKLEKAESELAKVLRKNMQYKERLRYTEALLQREKLDNENNLLALKRVLANNISTSLEHKINNYLGSNWGISPREKKSKIAWPESMQSINKEFLNDRERKKKFASTNSNTVVNSIASPGSRTKFEDGHIIKNKYTRSLNSKMSPLLSHQDQSFNDEEDIKEFYENLDNSSQSEDFVECFDEERGIFMDKNKRLSLQEPPSELDSSSEPTDELRFCLYGDQGNSSKKLRQIQYLQNKLAKLIDKDENGSRNNIQYSQPMSHRNYESVSSHRVKGHTNSCYNFKGQQSTFSKVVNLSPKYEQHANVYRKTHDSAPPPIELFSNSGELSSALNSGQYRS